VSSRGCAGPDTRPRDRCRRYARSADERAAIALRRQRSRFAPRA
jgi:hypothetical protein